MRILGLVLILGMASQAMGLETTKMKVNNRARASVETTSVLTAVEVETLPTNAAISMANYYPAMGTKVFQITPTFYSETRAMDLKTASMSGTGTGLITNLNYQVRMTEGLAVEVKTDFGTEESSGTVKNKVNGATAKFDGRNTGLGDFRVGLKTQQIKGTGNLYMGADLGLSVNNHEDGGEGNRFSGGHSLTPYVAYEQPRGSQVIGGKLAINLKANRTTESRSAGQPMITTTETGGNELSATGFTEWQARSTIKAGALARLDFVTDGDIEANNVSMNMSAYQKLTAGLYGETVLSKRTTLVPSVSLSTIINRGSGSVDTLDTLSVGLGARIAL